jgi:phytoene desaturase
MPDLVADAFAAVGERLDDWLQLSPVDPAYRAHFPDGSTLDVIADRHRMAAEVERVCGGHEARGYLRFADHVSSLWRLERHDFIERNLDSPRDLLTANLLRLAAVGGFRRLQSTVERYFADPRTRRVFAFQALYAGLSPYEALGLYGVIDYMDTVAGVYFPRGGVHAIPTAMAAAAAAHGVSIRYGTTVTRVLTTGDRATGVETDAGDLVRADVVVLNPDLPVAYRELLGERPHRVVPVRSSPSAFVLHLGSRQGYAKIAQHNLHFGHSWRSTFRELIREGRLMSDPSLFVSNPSRGDPSMAPDGRQAYYVLAPVPNIQAARQPWSRSLTDRYARELLAVLEQRGYVGFGDSVELCRTVTPADWAAAGMAAGTPFAAAHTLSQTGPFRPSNLHPRLSNVVFAGSGTQPGSGVPMVVISGKLAAERITGSCSRTTW